MLNRAFEVQADPRGYTEIDIMKIQVPEGYSIENALEPIELKTEFGQYSLSHEVAPDGITIKRSLQINPSVQPKEAYQTLRNFMLAITKADKTKLVLVNRT